MNESITELEKTITEEGQKLPGHKNLTSIKGIGPLTGSILLSVIGESTISPRNVDNRHSHSSGGNRAT